MKKMTRKRPNIVVPFTDKTSPSAIRQAKNTGMDLAELRIDLYGSQNQNRILEEIRKFSGIPTIATIRSKKEGGVWGGSEKQRLELFQTVIPWVNAVDIELSSRTILKEVVREAHRRKKSVIVSFHDFKKTPSPAFLTGILKKAKAAGADVVKIAVMARSARDVKTLAQFTVRNARHRLITLSMGEKGAVSRILFPGLGSLATFAHIGKSTAPGQWDLRTTSRLFKKLYS